MQTVSEDAGWCWFQDPRIIFVDNSFYVGFVHTGFRDKARLGDVRVSKYQPKGKWRQRATELILHSPPLGGDGSIWNNDHNSPALIRTGKEKIMAFWSLHGQENCFYTQEFDTNMKSDGFERKRVQPSDSSRITYSNPIYLRKEERLYNFFRGLDDSWKPSYAYSDNFGDTFNQSHVLINSSLGSRSRSYVKYVSNGEDAIHFFF